MMSELLKDVQLENVVGGDDNDPGYNAAYNFLQQMAKEYYKDPAKHSTAKDFKEYCELDGYDTIYYYMIDYFGGPKIPIEWGKY